MLDKLGHRIKLLFAIRTPRHNNASSALWKRVRLIDKAVEIVLSEFRLEDGEYSRRVTEGSLAFSLFLRLQVRCCRMRPAVEKTDNNSNNLPCESNEGYHI